MPTADDPTLALIASLDRGDPTEWEVVRNVPVCKPHRRVEPGPGGQAREVRVTAAGLARIAARVNAAYDEDGVPVRVTVGHIRGEKGFPETEQPPLVGFAKNATVGRFGPKGTPGVLVDLYVRRKDAHVLSEYPFRSMEFDPGEGRIHGLALLKRDPWLDMGAIHYAGDRFLVTYGAAMNEQTDMAPGGDDVDPIEYEKFKKYVAKYIAETNDGGLPGGQPAPADAPPAQVPYQKGEPADAAVLALQAQVATLQKQAVESESARLLDALGDTVKYDRAREVKTLVSYATADERAAHVQYMLDHYEKQPTGWRFVPTLPTVPAGRASAEDDPTVAPANHEKVMAYMRARPGLSYEQAATEVK